MEFVSYLGGLIDVHCRLNAADTAIAQIVNTGQTEIPKVGDTIGIGWSAQAAFVFSEESA